MTFVIDRSNVLQEILQEILQGARSHSFFAREVEVYHSAANRICSYNSSCGIQMFVQP